MKAKVLPRPGSLSTLIEPPSSPTSRAAMVRPKPVPPYLRVVEVSSCSNARKIFSCLSGGMPMPVSRTANRRPTSASGTRLASDFHVSTQPRRVGELDGVAHEIDEHLAQPAGVADQGIGHAGPLLADQLQPLLVGPHGQGSQVSPSAARKRKIGRVQFQRPASILAKSRMSLMRPSRLSAADLTVVRYCRWSSVSGVSRASSVMPRMAFMGVRISWLTLARNSSLARFADSAASLA